MQNQPLILHQTEYQNLLDNIAKGQHTLLTGDIGAGKSYLLRQAQSQLDRAIYADSKSIMEEQMTQLEIKNKIKQIVANVTDVNREEIGDDTSLDESLGVDSLARIEILIEVDLMFELGIPDDEFANIRTRTVQDLVEFVVQYKKQKGGSILND